MASVKVAVRVRPFNRRETHMGSKCIIEMENNKTRIFHKGVAGKTINSFKEFSFDYSYWSMEEGANNYVTQQKVFQDLGTDVVGSAFEGYNACLFAYGQTGSGKTYTMMGTPDNQGLIPRICESLFNRMISGSSYRVEVSYLEIYNEKVKDLLSVDTGHNLRVREHPRLGPIVQDLSKHLVSEYSHILALMSQGNSHRTTANTNMNDFSSRSHAIFTIMFVQAGICNNLPTETVSKIHLVDLAGSERADATGATGQRLKEGAHINKSLVTLGSVISALAELSSAHDGMTQRNAFIPYRDSVLTWLLKDSLGGNSKTIMIAAISPADCNYSETLSTLRYANRAKNIINKPTINEDPNVKLIRELRDEISRLKALISSEYPDSPNQVLVTLYKKEAEEKVLTERWAEKWKETQVILQEQEALALRKAGTGIVLDSERPHLICFDDNLLSTGVTLYHLKDGETLIGTEDAPQKQHIILTGNEMEPEHCSIILENGKATLVPKPNAHCWVNGSLADKPTVLFQGCIILVGRTNMFRYNDPVQAEKMRKEGNVSHSHLNLSRMSLMTWSSLDLIQSSDLNTNCEIMIEKDVKRNEENLDSGLSQVQVDPITKMETVECAEKQFEEERSKIESLYKSQTQQLAAEWKRLERHKAESIAALNNKEAKLNNHWQLVQKEIADEVNQLRKERIQLESVRSHIEVKKFEFTRYIARKMDALIQDSNSKKSEVPLCDTKLSEYRDLLDKLSSGNITIEFLSRKINSDSESSFKDMIMDGIKHYQQTVLAPIDLELKHKAEKVLERGIKIKELESELSLIIPFNYVNDFSKGNSQLVIEPSVNNRIIECSVRSHTPVSLESCTSVITSNLRAGLNRDNGEMGCTDYSCIPDRTALEQINFGQDTLNANTCLVNDLLQHIKSLRLNILHGLESGANEYGTDAQIGVLQEIKEKCYDSHILFENVNESSTERKFFKDKSDNEDCFNVQLSSTLKSTVHTDESPLCSNISIIRPSSSLNYSQVTHEETVGIIVQVPSFVLRGTGANTHYVYEVALQAGSENWTILRRYSRFRELHLTMKEKYGAVVASLLFPPRKLFFRRSEDIAIQRRSQLETYLQSLIHVCSRIHACPLYFYNTPSKQAVLEFSPFFRRGIFETGKYTTS